MDLRHLQDSSSTPKQTAAPLALYSFAISSKDTAKKEPRIRQFRTASGVQLHRRPAFLFLSLSLLWVCTRASLEEDRRAPAARCTYTRRPKRERRCCLSRARVSPDVITQPGRSSGALAKIAKMLLRAQYRPPQQRKR